VLVYLCLFANEKMELEFADEYVKTFRCYSDPNLKLIKEVVGNYTPDPVHP
jgi:hypothetical protein